MIQGTGKCENGCLGFWGVVPGLNILVGGFEAITNAAKRAFLEKSNPGTFKEYTSDAKNLAARKAAHMGMTFEHQPDYTKLKEDPGYNQTEYALALSKFLIVAAVTRKESCFVGGKSETNLREFVNFLDFYQIESVDYLKTQILKKASESQENSKEEEVEFDFNKNPEYVNRTAFLRHFTNSFLSMLKSKDPNINANDIQATIEYLKTSEMGEQTITKGEVDSMLIYFFDKVAYVEQKEVYSEHVTLGLLRASCCGNACVVNRAYHKNQWTSWNIAKNG